MAEVWDTTALPEEYLRYSPTVTKLSLPMKRRLGEEDSSSDDWIEPKRFLTEEMMTSHMQQLYLNTPPHDSPTSHNELSGYTFDQVESDWLDTVVSTSNRNDNPEIVPLWENLEQYLDTEIPVVENVNKCEEDHPQNREDRVFMEDNSEDSSDGDNNHVHVWIAPEMRNIMNSKQSLLPDAILDEMSRPCTAVVPYVKPNLQLVHHVWKNDEQLPIKPLDMPSIEPLYTPPIEPLGTPPIEPLDTPPIEPLDMPPIEPLYTPPIEPLYTPPIEPLDTTPIEPLDTLHHMQKPCHDADNRNDAFLESSPILLSHPSYELHEDSDTTEDMDL